MRWINDKSVDELKKLRKTIFVIESILIIFGGFFELLAIIIYLNTYLIVIPLIYFLIGVQIIIVAAMPTNLSFMIYLKEKEKL